MFVSYYLLLETEDRKVDTKERKVFNVFFSVKWCTQKNPEGNSLDRQFCIQFIW